MRLILTTLITLLLATLALATMQYRENKKLTTNLATTQRMANQQQAVINELEKQKSQQKKAQQALAKDLQKNKTAVLKQLNKLKELENENQNYRDWSSMPIPAAVIGLQQRPSITGSEHYRQHLRDRHPMSIKPNTTAQQ